MLRLLSRYTKIILMFLLIVLLIPACDSGKKSESSLPLLKYTVYTDLTDVSTILNNPNDVVTPYIENKFNIKVKDFYPQDSESYVDRIKQWIAAGNLPDVFLSSQVEFDATAGMGIYADIESYIKDMPNFNKYFDKRYWPMFENNGKLYQIPVVETNSSDPGIASSSYDEGLYSQSMWVREDILAKCGYKFKPMDEINKETTALGRKPTLDDLKIEPGINTPQDFYNLLRKIKALNITVSGKPLIPLSMLSWQQFHFGTMFDFGHWRIDQNGNVGSYLGLPGAEPWYKMLNSMYNEGLLDEDFMVQTDEQLQKKVQSGLVACAMWVPDENAARKGMQAVNPDAKMRYIPWPKESPGKGFYDVYKNGFRSVCINKDFKDIKRLIQYFDWFYSDEGLDTITWGPESAGLWEIKDGKKVFKDTQVESDILNGVHGGKGADNYGLYDWSNHNMTYASKAVNGVPFLKYPNPKSYLRSYPPKLNIYDISRNILGMAGIGQMGNAAYGDGSELVDKTSSYYWNTFIPEVAPMLITAANSSEFEKAWNKAYNDFIIKGSYNQAVENMKKFFNEFKK